MKYFHRLKLLSGILLSISSISIAYAEDKIAVAQNNPVKSQRSDRLTESKVVRGAYDPNGDFSELSTSQLEHVFLPWTGVDLTSLVTADAYSHARNRSLLLTVEPWAWEHGKNPTPQGLLKGILDGKFDDTIKTVAKATKSLQSPLTIRWGQEMDDKDSRFPWAHWEPKEFVAAYRHFVDVFRTENPNVKFMWSPMGNAGLDAYYPGPDYVDMVGLSIFGYQPYDVAKSGHSIGFADKLSPSYARVAKFNRPVVIAELGYSGDKQYVQDWQRAVAEDQSRFPELRGMIYFNAKEVYPWPDGFGRPDWRISHNILEQGK